MNNSLHKIEQSLRSITKRYKTIKYSIGLAILFLMLGINAFSEEVNGTEFLEQSKTIRSGMKSSIEDMRSKIESVRVQNNKGIGNLRLEMIQLTEQGDQVVKSPWNSWQFGANYFYNNWRGTYEGKGDKKEKYPFEGIFSRSSDLFLRTIHPDSNFYNNYTSNQKDDAYNSATTSTIEKKVKKVTYGLASTVPAQEPLVDIELGAVVRPKNIGGSVVTINPPNITVNSVTPLSNGAIPNPPESPNVDIRGFSPVVPDPKIPALREPDIFNIKLGSYRNHMTQSKNDFPDYENGGRLMGDGKSYNTGNGNITVHSSELGSPTTIYAWETMPPPFYGVGNYDSALLKAYFDYTRMDVSPTGGGTLTVTGNLTIDSISNLSEGQKQYERAQARTWNAQKFFVGGSRVATLDNVGSNGATLVNNATVNMVGPLVVGYEVQNDRDPQYGTRISDGKRELRNEGILTDKAEEDLETIGGLKKGKIGGGYNIPSDSINLELAPNLGGNEHLGGVTITRTPDIVDKDGNIKKKGGYTGYKVGMILTQEFDEDSIDGYYKLVNNGTISFMGERSIGIQIYAPPEWGRNTTVEVINKESASGKGEINLGGKRSYGMKLSSAIWDILYPTPTGRPSVFENRGTINISGGDGTDTSLSAGMAVVEELHPQHGNHEDNMIRAYNGIVKNKGTINISGGRENVGMLLKTKANDDITNTTTGIINVSGIANIGMRVEEGIIAPRYLGYPDAINEGNINISSDENTRVADDGNVGMIAKKRSRALNKGTVSFNGPAKYSIGLLATDKGEGKDKYGTIIYPPAKILNQVNGKILGGLNGTKLENTIGMAILKDAEGQNAGKIEMNGSAVTAVHNDSGTFTMVSGSIKTTGDNSISLYSKGINSTTNITGGTISAGNNAVALYPDNKTTINLGGTAKLEVLNGGLMFYNYDSKSGNSNGIVNLVADINGDVKSGGTVFYFKGASPNFSTLINNMFTGPGKLKLKMEDKSTLFVLESPSGGPIKLSTIGSFSSPYSLGSKIDLSRTTSTNYKAFKVYKGVFEIDKDVSLDNNTDDFYKMEFSSSNVKVDEGKNISGSIGNKTILAQANYVGATNSSGVKVINKGNINYTGNKSTALAVDFAQAINEKNATIKMSGDNSIGLYGAANSFLNNKGTIEVGKAGVGIWGANSISKRWTNENISIVNFGTIKGISGKEGVFGIYANNTSKEKTTTSTVNHTGKIDLSESDKSTGILLQKGSLTSSGNISIKDESVGVNAINSSVTISGGNYKSVNKSTIFRIKGIGSKILGNSGDILLTGKDSIVYLLDGVNLSSGVSFKDNLTLTSANPYTYINIKNGSILSYKNTKTINNNGTIFINSNKSKVTLRTGTNINSEKQKVVGVYGENNSEIINQGKISLTGDKSIALYGNGSRVSSGSTAKITIGKNGSGIYVLGANGINAGELTIGEASVGMRVENGLIQNESSGIIKSIASNAIGMSQSRGIQNIKNNGKISLTGDKSIALHSEGITVANHKIINNGNIIMGDSSDSKNPSIGIYSANGINSTVESRGKINVGNKSTGIYAGNINLTGSSETISGNGGITIYSKEGVVNISENSKIATGETLGQGQEGIGVYLAGNSRVLNSNTDKITIGKGSFGYVMTGQGNTIKTGKLGTTGVVNLAGDSLFIYSADKTGIIVNYNNLKSTGNGNYGIYAMSSVENRGNIDFSQGVGNIGAYSYVKGATTTPNSIKNYGIIEVSATDVNNKKYGIGMAAGYSEENPIGSGNYVTRALGSIENHGTIKVTTPDSIGMYATGSGSKIINGTDGRIELSGSKRNIGIFAENGAEVINKGLITTVGSNNKGQIGIAIRKGAILDNQGTINIDAIRGYGLFVAGGIIKNYGTINVSGTGTIAKKVVSASDTSKEIQDDEDFRDTNNNLNKVRIHSPAGATKAKIFENGVVQTPTIVNVQAVPNRKPTDIPTSSVGMYMDTSGINYTRPINNIGALAGLRQGDLIVGIEATKYTTSKYIQLGQDIIGPYNKMIRTSGIEKWSIYSGSLTWMASITQLPDFTIRNAYLAKIPYTVFAGKMKSPVEKNDTYNFANGLDQRYGVEAIGSRENEVFQKLNSIGNNEEILLYQAFDEMMGHQYSNMQQRVNLTSQILDKELRYLKKEMRATSKSSNKIKTFSTRGEYKTNTAGVIDYTNYSNGVAYIHENEDIKLGKGIGWYAGIVNNTFKFKDIGRSKEEMLQGKIGIFKSISFDDNGSLNWIISSELSAGYNRMHRKFLVVNEVFNAKSKYYTYGAGIKNELGKEFRLSEGFSLRPYGAIKVEYGKISKIREKSGEIKLEVKSDNYVSVKPEFGGELLYKYPFSNSDKLFTTSIGVAYENELGKVANRKNKGKVVDTTAGWFNIRGEKEDRKGNIKTDFSIGFEGEILGGTANIGYDTKGNNIRGGVGVRIIF